MFVLDPLADPKRDMCCRGRWSPDQRLRDGSIPMRCPKCAGRVKSNAHHTKLGCTPYGTAQNTLQPI